MTTSAPILEFDGEPEAILEPRKIIPPLPTMPTHGVICFFKDVITHFVQLGLAQEIYTMGSEMDNHPVYVHEVKGKRVALFHPGVGAPLAAGLLEEVIALGCRNFVACGGAGVLNRELALGHLVVPTAAVRDEGTSYHYLPPTREVSASPAAVAAIERTLQQRNVPYTLGKTWTTDAIYRETRARMARRSRWKQQPSLPWRNSAASRWAKSSIVATILMVTNGMGATGRKIGVCAKSSLNWPPKPASPLRNKLPGTASSIQKTKGAVTGSLHHTVHNGWTQCIVPVIEPVTAPSFSIVST
jgi:uridine phosphorylase